MSFVIKLGSITNTQRAQKILSKNGVATKISRLSNPKPSDGCGYVLKANSKDREKIIHILNNSGINILGVENE
ncbi:MAG: DUF3343 domain-containing protein [Eubacterium sp.]|nr:DUF3343 domain-containing protein [Eubacterium sp.]